jgi:hypothetical protein
LLMQGALFLVYLPWARILGHQISTVQEGFWLNRPTALSLWNTFVAYTGSPVALILFLSLVCVAVIMKMKEKRSQGKTGDRNSFLLRLPQVVKSEWSDTISLLLMWLFIPILVPFVISFWTAPIYLTRGTIGAAFAFQVVVARGVDILSTRQSIFRVIMSVIVGVSFVNVIGYYSKIHKEQWRAVAAHVDEHATSKAVILFSPFFCQFPFDYYSHRNDLVKHPLASAMTEQGRGGEATMPHRFTQYEQVWVVACDDRRDGREEKQIFMADYLVTFDQRYTGIALLGFLRKAP